jgi:hypothetical protein
VITIAERGGRTDLSSRLRASRQGLRRTGVTVAVVGEYKKGKSNLVNALVNAEVCPSDPVYATVVPIVVGYAEEVSVVLHLAEGGPEPGTGLEQVGELASESCNPANELGIVRIEVGLPRRVVATGLTFVDTPGVGGLESAVGSLVLASLEAADGVLFVTDCSQELTAAELDNLAAARQRCDAVICVMTKLDLYPHAHVLAARNRQHLDTAGLEDVPLITVSSLLHLLALAETDDELETESRFEELFELLHRRVWEPARRRGIADVGAQMASVAAHLTLPLEAEREASQSEESAARTIERLKEMQDRVRQLRSASARWQQRLAEGMQEAAADLDHDLRTRIRAVGRAAEGRAEVDADNPADDLVFESWLHKATMEAVLAHYSTITERASALADEVAELFVAFDRESEFHVDVAAPAERLSGIHVVRDTSPIKDGVLRRVVTTTQGYSSGLVLASSLFALWNPVAWIPLLTVPIAGYMARRAFSDDRARRKAMRTQELKRLASRYLDETSFVVQKDARDTIRRLHREIREHFAERTEQLERTLQQAMDAAERARAEQGTGPDQQARDHSEHTIRELRSTAERLVATAAIAS